MELTNNSNFLHLNCGDTSALPYLEKSLKKLTKNELGKWNVSITDIGKKVLKNDEDYILLNGIDCWFGGVHLAGKNAQWRWDKNNQKLRKKL